MSLIDVTTIAPTPPRQDRWKKVIDWGMFSIGALSLAVAIGGTVLTSLEGPPATAATEATIATVAAG